MNTTDDKLNDVIASYEKEIAEQKKALAELNFAIKTKEAKLRKLKKINKQLKSDELPS